MTRARIYIFILVMTSFITANAQSKYIDSLRASLKSAKHDTTRVDIYLLWGEQIYLNKPDSGIILWDKARNISEAGARKNSSNKSLRNTYLARLSSALSNLGAVYENQGDIVRSLDNKHKSLKISEEIGDTAGIANSFNNMGVLYFYQNDLTRALDYFTKSLKMRERLKDKAGISYCLNNIGEVLITEAGQINDKRQKETIILKALENYKRALKLREEVNDKVGIAQSLNSIAGAYDGLGGDSALHKALDYYTRAAKVHGEAMDKGGMSNATYNAAAIYHDMGDLGRSIKYALQSLALAKEVGYPGDIRNAAKLLYICYKQKGDYKKAYEYYSLQIEMRDSIMNAETKKATIKSQLKYEYEKRAAADSVKNFEEQKVKDAQLAAQNAQIKQEKFQRYALLAGLFIVIVGLVFVVNRFRLTQKQKKIIELQKQRVDRAYEELHEKNKEILDSIRYARRIQSALLPNEKYIARHVKRGLFLILLFYSCLCPSQNKTVDSLKRALANAKHDTARCTILNELVENENDDAIWPLYNKELLFLAQKNLTANSPFKKFYLKSLSTALNNMGYLANFHGKNDSALFFYEKAFNIQKELNYKKGMSSSVYNMGDVLLLQGNIAKGLEYLYKSLKIQEEIRDTFGQCYSLNNIGAVYKGQGDYENALLYAQKALALREKIGDKQGIANSLTTIGYIYWKQGNNKKAMECYKRSFDLMEEVGDKRGAATALNYIGNIYSYENNWKQAKENYERGAKIQEEINEVEGLITSLNNIAIAISALSNDRQEELNRSLLYSLKSLKMAREHGFPGDIKNAALTLKQTYLKQKNYKKSFEYYELYIQMKDSLNNAAIKKAGIKKQLQYTYEKRAAADSVKNVEEQKVKDAQLAAQNAQIQQEKFQRYALIVGLLVVLVGLGFVINRYRLTQKQKKIIELQKERVDHAYEELHEKNKEILDSIYYARRIQRALLPNEKYIEKNLKK